MYLKSLVTSWFLCDKNGFTIFISLSFETTVGELHVVLPLDSTCRLFGVLVNWWVDWNFDSISLWSSSIILSRIIAELLKLKLALLMTPCCEMDLRFLKAVPSLDFIRWMRCIRCVDGFIPPTCGTCPLLAIFASYSIEALREGYTWDSASRAETWALP